VGTVLTATSLVGPQAMTMLIPLGTFIVFLIWAWFARRQHDV
jgi:hypothetical protein